METDKERVLLADIPGVRASDLTIDLNEGVLTLSGYAESPEKETENDIFREYRTGRYVRQFTVSEVIDQSKIEAELKEGVLPPPPAESTSGCTAQDYSQSLVIRPYTFRSIRVHLVRGSPSFLKTLSNRVFVKHSPTRCPHNDHAAGMD